MPIATTGGEVYEDQLDMLFSKDMPSRDEMQDYFSKKYKEQGMPPDMIPPRVGERLDYTPPVDEDFNQLNPQPLKDQNDPFSWGLGQVLQGLDQVINPNIKYEPRIPKPQDINAIPENAQQTAGELAPGLLEEPKAKQSSEQVNPPSPYGETYDKFVNYLEGATKYLNPSFIPTAEQFRDAPWKEKLGFILGTSMMLMGPGRNPQGKVPIEEPIINDPLNFWKEKLATYDQMEHPVAFTLEMAKKQGSTEAGRLLEEYNNIKDPVLKQEFGNKVREQLKYTADVADKAEARQVAQEEWQKANPNGDKKWTPDEDTLLANHLKDGKTVKDIASISGRSQSSVRSRINSLKKADKKFSDAVRETFGNTEVSGESGVTGAETPAETANTNQPLFSKEFEAFLEARQNNPNRNTPERSISSQYDIGQLTERFDKMSKELGDKIMDGKLRTTDKEYIDEMDRLKGLELDIREMSNSNKGTEISDKMHSDLKRFEATLDITPLGRKVNQDIVAEIFNAEEPQRNTELTGKSGISTPNTVPRNAANRNDNLQLLDNPEMEASIDKQWKSFIRAEQENLPIHTWADEKDMLANNPKGYKALKSFETEMNYKYKADKTEWVGDLTKEEMSRYKALLQRAKMFSKE